MSNTIGSMVVTSFNIRRPAAVLAQAQQVIASMTGNASFPEPWPAPVPSLAQITADATALQNVVTATSARDQSRIAERTAAAQTLATDLLRLGPYVELQAQGDALKLSGSGFSPRTVTPRRTVFDDLAAPARVSLAHGALSGEMTVKSSKLSGAGSYEVQLASADPTVETNWNGAGIFKNCRRIQIQSLTPGKTYSVRMRGIGNTGPGAWSVRVSLMSM